MSDVIKTQYKAYFVADKNNLLSEKVPGNVILELAMDVIKNINRMFRFSYQPPSDNRVYARTGSFYIHIGHDNRLLEIVTIKNGTFDYFIEGLMVEWEDKFYGCGLDFYDFCRFTDGDSIEEAAEIAFQDFEHRMQEESK